MKIEHIVRTLLILVPILFINLSLRLQAQAQPTGAAAADANATPVIRANARLVVLDVTVVDRQGVPVKGLSVDDFGLKEDGHPQRIQGVDDHGGSSYPAATHSPFASGPGDAVLNNYAAKGPVVWNVLMVDLLNTRDEDQINTRKQIEEFARSLPASQKIALVGMSTSLKLLVPFESGAAGISRALSGSALNASHSPLLDLYQSDDDALLGKMIPNAKFQGDVVNSHDTVETDRLGLRVETTLESFSKLAKWLSLYPGRKNVYWLSAGFPMQGEPAGSLGGTASPTAGNYAAQFASLQQTINKQMESARIAIYPIDIRGVLGGDILGVTNADSGMYLYVKNPTALAEAEGKFDRVTAQEQSEMLDIARATGGIARFNRNDIAGVLREDFDQSQNYYTLSYTPSNAKWSGEYRRIEVFAKEKSYRLVYRRGYYAKELSGAAVAPADAFTLALRHGATTATALPFYAKLNKVSGAVNVEYAIDSRLLTFAPDPSGNDVSNVICAVVEYDAAGKVMGTAQIRVTGKLNSEQRAGDKASYLSAQQHVPLLPGSSSLALGVFDEASGKFGSMEALLALR